MTLTQEQVRQTLSSPIIYLNINRSEIEARKENFLFATSGLSEKAYTDTIIVDSKGTSFKIKKVSEIGRPLFWTSIKYFSPVKEVLPDINGDIKTISVDEFKKLILDTISKKPRAWAALDSVENISKDIYKLKTYKEIISFFNPKLK